jgi:hypothetical protein
MVKRQFKRHTFKFPYHPFLNFITTLFLSLSIIIQSLGLGKKQHYFQLVRNITINFFNVLLILR